MNRWWEKYQEEDQAKTAVAAEIRERMECPSCGWSGVPIDHPRIHMLCCGSCLRGIPGTERKLLLPQCPECGTIRLTPDGNACLECDWPDVAPDPEPTTENPEDLE